MKNSNFYARKVKRILGKLPQRSADEPVDPIRLLVTAVLAENATSRQVLSATSAIDAEYVDFNELRVSPIKDIVECIGRGFPGARAKAEAVTGALNAVFERTNGLSMAFLAKKIKREVRRILREEMGLSPYAESVLTLLSFDGHAIPVDTLLLEALKLDKRIHPDSDVPDLQGFLERIIANKDAPGAHEVLRAYANKWGARVNRELARRAKVEAEARAEAEAKAEAKAEAEARAKAKAEAETKAKRAAAKKMARRKAAARKAASKKTSGRGKAARSAKKKAKARPAKKAPKPAKGKKKTAARKPASRRAKK